MCVCLSGRHARKAFGCFKDHADGLEGRNLTRRRVETDSGSADAGQRCGTISFRNLLIKVNIIFIKVSSAVYKMLC